MSLTDYSPYFAEMAEIAGASDPDLVAAYAADVANTFAVAGVDLSDPVALNAALCGAMAALGLAEMAESIRGGSAIFGVGMLAQYRRVSLDVLADEVLLP